MKIYSYAAGASLINYNNPLVFICRTIGAYIGYNLFRALASRIQDFSFQKHYGESVSLRRFPIVKDSMCLYSGLYLNKLCFPRLGPFSAQVNGLS